LAFFSTFATRLWEMGRLVDLANQHSVRPFRSEELSPQEKNLITEVERLAKNVGSSLNRYLFADAEDKLCGFLTSLEKYAEWMQTEDRTTPASLSVFKQVFKKYIALLHPFMPFMTEELTSALNLNH
jgi:valyl-tRNA synthetase